jgi:hypothetical protein
MTIPSTQNNDMSRDLAIFLGELDFLALDVKRKTSKSALKSASMAKSSSDP